MFMALKVERGGAMYYGKFAKNRNTGNEFIGIMRNKVYLV